ncbi:hypothetical protein PFISCL1PPCAC_836, partial [Pristionchus fissidentatus]
SFLTISSTATWSCRSEQTSSFLVDFTIIHWTILGVVFEIIFNAIMAFLISHFEPSENWKPEAQLVTDMFIYYGINMSRPF